MAFNVLNVSQSLVVIGGVAINPGQTKVFAALPYLTNDQKTQLSITGGTNVIQSPFVGQLSAQTARTAVGAAGDQTAAALHPTGIVIPAGTMGLNSLVRISAVATVAGATAGKLITARFGGQALATSQTATAAVIYATWLVWNNGALNAQKYTNATSAGVPIQTNAGALATATVNTANDVVVDVTGTFGAGTTASETIVLERVLVECFA